MYTSKNNNGTVTITMNWHPVLSKKLEDMGAKKTKWFPEEWVLSDSDFEDFQTFANSIEAEALYDEWIAKSKIAPEQ